MGEDDLIILAEAEGLMAVMDEVEERLESGSAGIRWPVSVGVLVTAVATDQREGKEGCLLIDVERDSEDILEDLLEGGAEGGLDVGLDGDLDVDREV